MFKSFRDALKIKEVRRALLFMAFAMVIIRAGALVPVPGVDQSFFAMWFASQSGSALGILNAFTGGSFESMSILALSITPYITSSIIIQLLTIAIPALEEMQRDGDDGRKKLTAITRYLTIGLSVMESTAMCIGFGRQGLIPELNFAKGAVVVCSLTAGSAFLMWLGERITEKGVGNGTSIILLINIVSRFPKDITALYKQFIAPASTAKGILDGFVIAAVIVLIMVLVILLEGGSRSIPVQYSRKIVGQSAYNGGGRSSSIPLKVNTAGVIPVIFASSIMSFPGMIAAFAGKSNPGGVVGHILNGLNQGSWFETARPVYTLGYLIYAFLIIFFAYFYTSITFNPLEIADKLRKEGGVIPGIRAGKYTTEYLNGVLKYMVLIGACGLLIIATIPLVASGLFRANVSFGGTSMIIVVGVILETARQIESKMAVRRYQGFLD